MVVRSFEYIKRIFFKFNKTWICSCTREKRLKHPLFPAKTVKQLKHLFSILTSHACCTMSCSATGRRGSPPGGGTPAKLPRRRNRVPSNSPARPHQSPAAGHCFRLTCPARQFKKKWLSLSYAADARQQRSDSSSRNSPT